MMNGPSYRSTNCSETHKGPEGATAAPSDGHVLGLQICRIGLISLTRLQLAFESGDRARAMEAIDRLGGLDAEIERLLGSILSASREERDALERQLREEKMALAFEKLTLASGVSGPRMTSHQLAERRRPVDDEVQEWPPAEAPITHALRSYGLPVGILLAALAAVAFIVH